MQNDWDFVEVILLYQKLHSGKLGTPLSLIESLALLIVQTKLRVHFITPNNWKLREAESMLTFSSDVYSPSGTDCLKNCCSPTAAAFVRLTPQCQSSSKSYVFRNSIPTSYRTNSVWIINTNLLMDLAEIIAVYCENHTRRNMDCDSKTRILDIYVIHVRALIRQHQQNAQHYYT